ncbi:hypothetical protein LVD17_04605 [Fulvivirga ulvae]|uniref:ParA family protein n=1 Tax=Fulvivirga ulvae TaxID=2904245 RepID=UPI001F18D82C|nr:hypothetical protein [Fulvivirga ulvae]UII33107.1 hypothetical protein LVD17_04605 [Fulvivirga ulvae]
MRRIISIVNQKGGTGKNRNIGLFSITISIPLVCLIIRKKTKNNVERQKVLLQMEVTELTKELLTMNENINKKNRRISKQAEKPELNITKDKILLVISHDLRCSEMQTPDLLNLFDSASITIEKFKSCIPNLKKTLKNQSGVTYELLHWSIRGGSFFVKGASQQREQVCVYHPSLHVKYGHLQKANLVIA